MLRKTLLLLRHKIRRREYVLTTHAEEEMSEDGLGIHVLERCILTGSIQERQRDAKTNEWKYRIRGTLENGVKVEVVAKLSITGKAVIITTYTC